MYDLSKVQRKLDIGDICTIKGFGQDNGYFIVDGICFRPEFDPSSPDHMIYKVMYEMVGIGKDDKSMLDYIFDEDVKLVAKKKDSIKFVTDMFIQNMDSTFGNADKLDEFIDSYIGNVKEEKGMVKDVGQSGKEDECDFLYEESIDGLLDAMNDQKSFVKKFRSESDEINMQIGMLKEVLGVK